MIGERTRHALAAKDRGDEEVAVLGKAKYQRDRDKHPGDGTEDAIEALGENESAVRLRYHEDGQKRPAWIIEASPECDVRARARMRQMSAKIRTTAV